MLRFGVLGPVEAVSDAGPLDLGGPQQRALLAVLLLRANEVMPRDRLIDELWGDAPPPTARETIKVYVARLRKILDESGDASLLVTRNGGYVFHLEPDQLDLERFQRLVDDGSRALASGDAARAATTFGHALALWRGSPLVDVANAPFVQSERARLEELHVAALEDRIDADLALGRSAALVPELGKVIREHPYRERLRRQLMLALYASGRQADALAAYQDTRKLFVEELGIEPSNELRRLEHSILTQDAALDAQVRTTPSPRWRQRSSRALAGFAVVVVALSAIAAVLLTRSDPQVHVHSNSVAVIDPSSNELVDDVSVGRAPAFVAATRNRVWVANTADRTVMEIDSSHRAVRQTIPLDARPQALAAGSGSVWVVTGAQSVRSPLELLRIEPRFGGVSRRQALGMTPPHMPRQPLAFAMSAIWAPGRFIGTLSRRDATTLAARAVVRLEASNAFAVAAGSEGLWAVTVDNRLLRIDRATNSVVDSIPTGARPLDVAVGGGSVWVASWSDDVVIRYDPITRSTISVGVGDGPAAVSFGFGSVWVACSGDGTVWRIDAATGKVVAHWELGASPEDIAAGGGGVWAAVYSELPP